MTKAELTSNQYWGGLNRRFDRRTRLLMRLGVQCNGQGWLSNGRKWDDAQQTRIPTWVMSNQFVMHANNRGFREMLPSLLVK
jgi:hypothetical protein